MIDAIAAADIDGIVFLGAMLADVPHTRPISVFATSENAAVRDRFELERSTYEGPVGILSVLGGCGRARRDPDAVDLGVGAALRAQRAVARRRRSRSSSGSRSSSTSTVDRGSLVEESAAWESGIDALAERRRRHGAPTSTQLEQARDTVDSPEASGDAIAEEFERYLRGATARRRSRRRPGRRQRTLSRSVAAGTAAAPRSTAARSATPPSSDPVDHERQERALRRCSASGTR